MAIVQPTLLSVEIIVESVERAIQLMVDTFGFPLVERRRTDDPAGEVAIVDAGGVLLSLLEPAAGGAGRLLPVRTPRLSQFVVGASPGEATMVHARVEAAGLASRHADGGRFFVTPESVVGALGLEAAIVVTPVDDTGR